jgi:hypothetical protein
MAFGEEILQFEDRSWDAAGDLVASGAREYDAVSIGGDAGCDLTAGFGGAPAAGAGAGGEMIVVEGELERLL